MFNSVPDALLKGGKIEEMAKWVNEHSDYVFLGAKMNGNMSADFVLAYERPNNHEGEGMNLLFNDGHVEWMTLKPALDLIEKQTAPANKPKGAGL